MQIMAAVRSLAGGGHGIMVMAQRFGAEAAEYHALDRGAVPERGKHGAQRDIAARSGGKP